MAANLSLKQLHYFVTLADTLHFTQAAANCFVTQSTLSGGVRELEKQVGVSLFERDNKRVMLTSAGEALRPLAIDLLSTAGDFLQLGSALATLRFEEWLRRFFHFRKWTECAATTRCPAEQR